MSKDPELLPLGSAVTVEIDDDEGTFIIIARGFQTTPEGFLAGYKAVQYPVGAGSGAREIVIREPEIAEVVFRGYETLEDVAFAKKQLEAAEAPPEELPALAEPDLTIDLSKPVPPQAASASASSSLAGPEGDGGVVISDPNDPFSELRLKGKRT